MQEVKALALALVLCLGCGGGSSKPALDLTPPVETPDPDPEALSPAPSPSAQPINDPPPPAQPQPPAPKTYPALSGSWDSSFTYDLSGAFPALNDRVRNILSTLNKIFTYCEITGFSLIDRWICDTLFSPGTLGDLAELTPAEQTLAADLMRYQNLMSILDNLAHLLTALRFEGTMAIAHDPLLETLQATIEHEVLVLEVLDLCCLGKEPRDCNPYKQPDYPACTRKRIPMATLRQQGIEALPTAFDGQLQGDEARQGLKYTLLMQPHTVRLKLQKLPRFVTDYLANIVVGTETFEGALLRFCETLDLALRANPDITWLPIYKPLCLGAIGATWKLVEAALADSIKDLDVSDLSGYASVQSAGTPARAEKLGTESYERERDGRFQGSYQKEADITGAWYARRKP